MGGGAVWGWGGWGQGRQLCQACVGMGKVCVQMVQACVWQGKVCVCMGQKVVGNGKVKAGRHNAPYGRQKATGTVSHDPGRIFTGRIAAWAAGTR